MCPDGFDYEQIPPGYYDKVAQEGTGVRRYWHVYKFSYVIEKIRALGAQDMRLKVVDLGCGPGTFLSLLSKATPIQGLGVDIAQNQIAYASQTYGNENLKFTQASLFDESLKPQLQEADVVTLIEVIEHVHLNEAMAILKFLKQTMKPNAHLLVTTPNYLSAWPILEQVVNYVSEVNYEDQHLTKLNRRKLQRLLEEAGFDKIHVRSYMHASPFIAGLVHPSVAHPFKAMEQKYLLKGGPLLCAQAQCPSS